MIVGRDSDYDVLNFCCDMKNINYCQIIVRCLIFLLPLISVVKICILCYIAILIKTH